MPPLALVSEASNRRRFSKLFKIFLPRSSCGHKGRSRLRCRIPVLLNAIARRTEDIVSGRGGKSRSGNDFRVTQVLQSSLILGNSSGAPNTIRTCDPRLRRAVLYPAELWAR